MELVPLASNENPLGPSPRALEAIGRAATRANRYPDDSGAALKHRLAERLSVTTAHLALGNGANELFELLARLFVGPADEVVVCRPTFLMYGLVVRRLGGQMVEVPARASDHGYDLDQMAAAIGPRTRMIVIANPNNPTGAIVRESELRSFLERVPAEVVIVSDEAYHEYVDDREYAKTLDHLDSKRSLVILRTFSKVHSLAGLRIGYAIAEPSLAAQFDRVRLPFSVNSLAQAAALAALDDIAHVERSRALVREERPRLARALASLGVRVFESHANFLLVDLGRDSGPVRQALEEDRVFVRGLVEYGLSASFVRISVGSRDENERLREVLPHALGAAVRS